jgi:heme exporter protein D
MNNDFLQWSGWGIAVLSLIVNVLQLLKNNALKQQIAKSNQTVGDNSKANQQTHSGTGHNVNAGRDANIQ